MTRIVGPVAQTNAENCAWQQRRVGITGQEGMEGAHANIKAVTGIELHVQDRIMAPVVHAGADLHAGQIHLPVAGCVIGGRKLMGRCRRRGGILLGPPVRHQQAGGSVRPVSHERHVGEAARCHKFVEDGDVPQHAVGFNVQATRVEAAHGHAAGGPRFAAVDNPRHRMPVAFGRELLPVRMRDMAGKETGMFEFDRHGSSVGMFPAWSADQTGYGKQGPGNWATRRFRVPAGQCGRWPFRTATAPRPC